MIQFPCLCSFQLEVPDELAGGLIQCPRCGRLNDVPALSDLAHLRDDGTIELLEDDPSESPPSVEQMKTFRRIYSRSSTDDSGAEIDLRATPEQIALAGDQSANPIPVHRAPRYDPVTGELVRPLEIMQDPDQPTGPIPVAKAALTYSTDTVKDRLTPGRILLELFLPINMIVMFFIYLLHAIAQFAASVAVDAVFPLWQMITLVVVIIPISLVILAHYGGVVESTGPDGRDDLPRPLRDAGVWDDLLMPMGRMFLAMLLGLGPAVLVLVWDPIPDGIRGPLALLAAAAGVVFLPALVLTTIAGTTVMNLRPDRVMGVMRACGRDYLVSVLGCLVVLGIYLLHVFGYYLLPDAWITAHPWLNGLVHPSVEYTTLGVAVYFGHFFTWHLGVVYRRHHEAFPWVMQRHIPRPRPAPVRRGVAPSRPAPADPSTAGEG